MAGLVAPLPALLATLIACFVLAFSPMWDFDVWIHLACGKALVETGRMPSTDLFSFVSPAGLWDTHEWLSQLLLYGIHAVAGTTGLTLVKASAGAGLGWLLFKRGRRSGNGAGGWILAAAIVWAALTMRWFLTERPQLFSYLLLATQLLVLERRRRPWVLVPIALLWANLHGGAALLAPGVLGLWGTGLVLAAPGGQERRELASSYGLLCAATLAAICVNPAGIELLAYPFRTLGDSFYMGAVREWTPPTPSELPVFFGFAALSGAVLALTFRRWTWPEILTVAAFAMMAAVSRRHIPLFCIAAAPPLARSVADLLARLKVRELPLIAGSIVIAFLPPVVATVKGKALRLGIKREYYPTGALAVLNPARQSSAGRDPIRLFSLHRWGGYLIWHLPEKWKIFIDGRQLVHGPELFREYHRILHDLPGGAESWRRHRPDLAVLDYGSGLGRRLARGKEYALIHWDDECVVYARRGTAAAGEAFLIRERAYRAYNPERESAPRASSALAEIRRATRVSPDSARPLVSLARLLLSRNEIDQAREAAAQALDRRPNAVPVLLTAADVALAGRDLPRAEGLLVRAARIGSDPAGTELARAKLSFARQREEEGRGRLARSISLGEELARRTGRPPAALGEARRFAGERLAVLGRPAAAAEQMRRAGNAFFPLARHESALACYKRGLELAPRDARLLHNLGTVLVAMGRSRDALTPFGKALKLAPRYVETRVARGVAYYKLGMVKLAKREWERALALKPGHEEASSYLRSLGEPVE